MKSVQEILQQTDRQQLIDNYLLKYPLEMEDFEPNQTIGEIEESARQQLTDYLDRLASVDTSKTQSQYLFYAYHHLENGIPQPSFALANLAELQEKGDEAVSYSYIYSSHAEVMSFLVAENCLTQHYQTELLVEIMHEAAFFGFNQEELAAARHQLDQPTEPQKVVNNDELPITDGFSNAEQALVNEIHELEQKIANSSRHNAIAEILQKN